MYTKHHQLGAHNTQTERGTDEQRKSWQDVRGRGARGQLGRLTPESQSMVMQYSVRAASSTCGMKGGSAVAKSAMNATARPTKRSH